jgi:AraC-like DNA-binding protein
MASVDPARHLLRAKDLADTRYFEHVDVDDLARAAGLSRAHFSREFRRVFGESPHVYLLTRRLERAAAPLRTTDHSVADICFLVGLQSVGSFTTSFRRMFDTSPTAYRKSFPPASRYARIPACVLRVYGRPQHRTFREDTSPEGHLTFAGSPDMKERASRDALGVRSPRLASAIVVIGADFGAVSDGGGCKATAGSCGRAAADLQRSGVQAPAALTIASVRNPASSPISNP